MNRFVFGSALAGVTFGTVESAQTAQWFQTSKNNDDRLANKGSLSFDTNAPTLSSSSFDVTIKPSTKYQSIFGFGGALTQSSATVYQSLPTDLKQKVIEAYYGESGIGYTTGRLPIHSCDFSVDVYTFDDSEGDQYLDNFDTSVKYDQNLSLPLIHDALAIRPDLTLFGSPWSPPAWMKDNNDMMHGGHLLDEYRSTWAKYFSKWLTAYKEQGVSVWGVTVQNEPEASQSWESCLYTPEATRDFVAEYLGPVLSRDHPSVKILGFDHNKDHIVDWADTLLAAESPSSKYMEGIAFHWYSGSCFNNVQTVSSTYPNALLLPSEACYELTVLEDDASDAAWLVNGTWSKGEGYGYDIMGDLESGSGGWTDWNILLDSMGGPNHVGNFCDAAIIADIDTTDGSPDPAVFFHPQYYYMGHFSKFLVPGSLRVKSEVNGASPMSEDDTCTWPYGTCNGESLYVTSWRVNEKGGEGESMVTIVMNCGDDDKDLALNVEGVEGTLYNAVPAHSIQTYVIAAAV
jgi:glucosylceramidase